MEETKTVVWSCVHAVKMYGRGLGLVQFFRQHLGLVEDAVNREKFHVSGYP